MDKMTARDLLEDLRNTLVSQREEGINEETDMQITKYKDLQPEGKALEVLFSVNSSSPDFCYAVDEALTALRKSVWAGDVAEDSNVLGANDSACISYRTTKESLFYWTLRSEKIRKV